MKYIDQASNEIAKMLAIARKKKREREKQAEFNDDLEISVSLQLGKQPSMIETR